MQLDQSKAWWEEQAASKAAVKAAQHEAEQAFAELTRYQVGCKHMKYHGLTLFAPRGCERQRVLAACAEG